MHFCIINFGQNSNLNKLNTNYTSFIYELKKFIIMIIFFQKRAFVTSEGGTIHKVLSLSIFVKYFMVDICQPIKLKCQSQKSKLLTSMIFVNQKILSRLKCQSQIKLIDSSIFKVFSPWHHKIFVKRFGCWQKQNCKWKILWTPEMNSSSYQKLSLSFSSYQ